MCSTTCHIMKASAVAQCQSIPRPRRKPPAGRALRPARTSGFCTIFGRWRALPQFRVCVWDVFSLRLCSKAWGPTALRCLGHPPHTLPLEPEAVRTVLVPLRVWAGTRLGSPWPRRAPPGPPPLRLSVPSGTCASAASMPRPASARPRACARRRPRSPWPPRRPTLAGARAPVAAGPDVARREYRSARPRLRACAAGAVPHTASLCVSGGQLGPLLTGFPTPLPRSSGCRRRPCPPHAVPHAGQERARPRPATRVRLCCGV